MELKDLATLPEQLQVIFVSGYLGYSIAYSGFRENERKEDLFYGVLSFGIFGFAIYDLSSPYFESFAIPGLLALLTSVGVAMLWRKYVKRWFFKMLHKAAISNEDGIPTVWSRITQDTTIAPRQLTVELKDGSKYICDDVDSFATAPIPMYYTDSAGNIAMHVTHKAKKDEAETPVAAVRHDSWGDRITYIPAKDIATIDFRFVKR